MWNGLDPQWRIIRDLVALQHQTPTHEWPLIFVDGLLLVIRAWPNGTITSYLVSQDKTCS